MYVNVIHSIMLFLQCQALTVNDAVNHSQIRVILATQKCGCSFVSAHHSSIAYEANNLCTLTFFQRHPLEQEFSTLGYHRQQPRGITAI